jgi:Tol biopolymer transport system component
MGDFAFSRLGALVYVPGSIGVNRTLVWADRQGAVQPVPAPPRPYFLPRLSPDGRLLAVDMIGQGDVWVYDFARSTLTRLTFQPPHVSPIWSPDGKRVAFSSGGGGKFEFAAAPADGSGAVEKLLTGERFGWLCSWSPDGKTLLFNQIGASGRWQFFALPLEGDRKPAPIVSSQFTELNGMFSPDGRWIAYQSDESGQNEVYVRPFPGPGGKWQVSIAGGQLPRWARSGRELFFRLEDKVFAVDVETKPVFRAGTPKVLFEGPYDAGWDVAPDGKRFLMIRSSDRAATATQAQVVLEWFDDLKRRAPPAKK